MVDTEVEGIAMVRSRVARIYQFKVTLKGIRPPIWRRIQVPASYTFWDLHVAIQDAMGWDDCHLHVFRVWDPMWLEETQIGLPSGDFMPVEGEPTLPGWKQRISSVFTAPKESAVYEYDFGDGWEHAVILEKILPAAAGLRYPVCTAGKRACPPEDCGGIWGYEELLEIRGNPDHQEHEEMMEWLGEDFDPEAFHPGEVVFTDPRRRLKHILPDGP